MLSFSNPEAELYNIRGSASTMMGNKGIPQLCHWKTTQDVEGGLAINSIALRMTHAPLG